MFLRDADLVGLVTNADPMVTDFPPKVTELLKSNPNGPHSPVQPTSIDIHVGLIDVPSTTQDNHQPSEYLLPPGHSVSICSHEIFHMPKNIGGAAFPLAGRQQKTLLMLNPGHIDPGYEGKLWFAFTNVGRSPVLIQKGEKIATVLFWQTSKDVASDFTARYGTEDRSRVPKQIREGLSGDTLMVDDRAREVAQEVVSESGKEMHKVIDATKEELNGLNRKAKETFYWASILGVAIPTIVLGIMSFLDSQFGNAASLRSDLSTLQSDVKVLNERIGNMKGQTDQIGQLRNDVDTISALKKIEKDVEGVKFRLESIEKKTPTTKSP